MASTLAQPLFVAAQQARDAGISPAALFKRAEVPFELAGRVGIAVSLGLFALSIFMASGWLAFYCKPKSNNRLKITSWAILTIIGGALFCAHIALLIAYGQLAPALVVCQAILCSAFFVIWVAVLQFVLQQVNEVPLLDSTDTDLGRPIISRWIDHGIACLIPLPVGIALVAQCQSAFAAIDGLSVVLAKVMGRVVETPLVTDLLSPASSRLGQADITTLEAWLSSALAGVFHSDATLALTRMALALILVPLALALEALVCIRLNAFIKHAQTFESKRIAEMNVPRLLRLPSLASTEPLQWSPPRPQQSQQNWPEDIALLRNGVMSAEDEADLPRLPAATLLRAPTMKTVSSKYSTCTGLTRAPSTMDKPDTVSRSPSASMANVPTEASLLSFRKKHLLVTLAICAAVLVYAGAELVSALLGGTFRLLPLAIIALVCVGTQGIALVTSWLARRRQPKHLVIEKMGQAV